MSFENIENFNKYFYNQISDFNDSTILNPNLMGNKEDIKILEASIDIINQYDEFCNENSITQKDLLLSAVSMALNKFNFSHETLLYHGNNIPFAIKSENRQISIKEYLDMIHNDFKYNLKYENESAKELLDENNLKPELYINFNSTDNEWEYQNQFNIISDNEKITITFLYNEELYSKDYAELFLKSIETILKQLISCDISKTRICDISLSDETEDVKFKDVELPFLHKRFERQVSQTPNNIALVSNNKRLTYQELNDKANRIANGLIKRGVKAGSNVLIMLNRDENLIAGILGILKAGCAYIPIDPEYPDERIRYIYQDSQAEYIISDASTENSIDIEELLKQEDTNNPDVKIDSDDMAYIIYTSGSTGNPKGVKGSHKNITNVFSEDENNDIYNEYVKMNRNLSISTVSFVAFLVDFMSLTFGTTLILANDDEIENIEALVRLMQNEKPDALTFITPSRLRQYLEDESFTKELSSIDYITIGGEMVTKEVLSKLAYDKTSVYIGYGSTETSGFATIKKITTLNDDLTIGKSVHNVTADVRDVDGKILPQKVMGELYIGGNNIAKGYYNLDEESNDSFLNINNISYYKTGDYAIETPDGEIKLKGRIDNQIKLRGLRIELGEVDSNISQYPNIKENVVVIKSINNEDHLCTYFTAEYEINTKDLKEFLKERLTRYMLPSVFMQLDEMPKTPNGKVSIKDLPKPKLDFELIAPETKTEKALFEIASSISKTTEFGITDDLYAIGFTSLTLMKFIAAIYKKTNINLNISKLIDNPTIRDIANLIDNSESSDYNRIIEDSRNSMYIPLTANQLGVYYECAQNPDEAQYNLPSLIKFDKSVVADKLRDAVIKTINAYPYLKTRIVMHGDKLMHKRDDSIAVEDIPIIKQPCITDEEIQKSNSKKFDLLGGQLFRAKIYDTDDEVILYFDIHHLITDGESIDKLFRNFAYAYEGKEIESELFDGYADALLEAESEGSDEYVASENYFHDLLTQEVDSTVLTPNLNGNPDNGKIRSVSKYINPKLIRDFCASERISPNVLFMASIILNLNKYTFTDKTLITTIFNGRTNSNYFNTQAFLVKTLPILSINEDRNISIRKLLNQTDNIWKECIKHSNYPYTKISEEFGLKPEFMYTYSNRDEKIITINDKKYHYTHLETLETNYKITFNINESEDNIELSILYNNQLYTEKYIKVFLNGVLTIINQFIAHDIDNLTINEIELYKHYELPTFTPVDTPLIHKRFEKQVEESPDNTALVAGDVTLTYEELNKKANRIANALIKKGIKAKSNVLVMLHRNSDLIASILGIWKAGCVYIPIDLEYPKDRIEYIYNNSQAEYIISDVDDGNSLNVNELLEESDTSNPEVMLSPDDLAYMIYTSGSTGNPKGVMISHENLGNLLENLKPQYNRVLSIITVSFDPSILDIFSPLITGLKLILANDIQVKNILELIKLINDEKPDILVLTPSRLASYLEVPEFCEAIKCLKCLFLGGEQFSTKVYETFRKYSDAVVYNIYGPTETTIASNMKEITDVNDITVGHPLHNYVTDVRDIDGKLLPPGVMGELYIGGVGVGKGYYNMPDKTEEVFVTINDIPYYRSGDYAIELPNGEIDIQGRIDNQIKLRGLRIEIGEIESSINKYPSVRQAVVVIRKISNNDHLCAYYTADEELETGELKEFLKNKLTKYMIPTAYMQLDEMPQTPNGKTDIKALPEPILYMEYMEAQGKTEQQLFEMAAELINTDQFGVTDDLYSVGFTSLILMKYNSLIYAQMGVNIDISVLFNNPTIRKLATEIDGSSQDADLAETIELAKTMDCFPLTENQLGVYYECIQSPDEIRYTMPTVIRFDSQIDAQKLKDAIIRTVKAHPYLKTRIITTDSGQIRQKRNDDAEIDEIEIVSADSISDSQIIENDVRVFKFGDEQLFRFKIYQTPDEVVLFSDFHHIITDGVSQINLFADIARAYEGKQLSQEIVDGYAYSLIEEENKDSDRYLKSKEFFDEKLSQEIESTILTPNLNGNPDEGQLKTVVYNINPKDIEDFCNANTFSKNSLFLSALSLTLNKYTFSDKTLITTIFNGRSNSYHYNTQGYLVKTLPLIFNNENRQVTIKEFINTIDDTWNDTISHIEYPYTSIADSYQLKPEFFFSYQEFYESDELYINGYSYQTKELTIDVEMESYKIYFDIFIYKDNMEFKIDYNDELYTEEYIQKFLDSMNNVLNQFIRSDINKFMICDVELETKHEMPTFTQVDTPFLHKRFEKRVEENPDNTALVAEDVTLTYEELNKKANRIANALIKKGIKAKSNILVMLHRNSDLIASILGILKAGCAYIPIDLEYPKDRIEYIYDNSQAEYIISDVDDGNSLNVNELLEESDTSNPEVMLSPDDLAYMIYTSGSTGNPKGVMISHENICNQVENPKSQYNRLLCLTTVSFDVSVDDILTSLSNGLKLILASDTQIKNIPELIRLIGDEKPDILDLTPSRLASYLEVPEFCEVIKCLKCLFLGGEQFSTKVYENFRKYSDAVVYNSYGPTETTITSNNKMVTDVNDITVGYPLHNYVTDVRDIDGKLLPRGVMGELYIGGVGVGKGYYNMPDKTEEVFVTINDIPYYRSGDYAIELPNGEIDIQGRIDNQIKLRGLRIEIGEIESSINKYPSVRQAVVVIRKISNNDHLCAYYTADEELETGELKEFLKNKLTKYMIPTAYMQLDEMPQTPNGKTDIKALPEPILYMEYMEAQGKTEQQLFEMAAELINTDQFGVTDDLYSVGFTSLILMKYNSLIYAQMGVNIDISVLFNNPTIRKLATEIDGSSQDADLAETIELAKTMDCFPLTENQLGVYYECIQSPDEIRYTMPTVIRFDSQIDAQKLKDAIIRTVKAHPYLKTRIITTDSGQIRQKRNDDAEIDEIEIVSADSISDSQIIENDVRVFKFGDEQLFRFKIYQTPDEVVLFSDFHHIITDGVSQINLFADIARAYEGKQLSQEIVDGYAYSLIEEENKDSDRYLKSKEFFDEKLSQEIESTILTPNLNGNPDEGQLKMVTDYFNSDKINELCAKYSLSKNAVILSALTLTLNKYTFSDKTFITTIFNGRSNPYYYDTQGFLVKTLPLIFNNEDRQVPIKEFINDINDVWKDTITHTEYPYTNIADSYQLKPEFFFSYQEFYDTDGIIINEKTYHNYELSDDNIVTTEYKVNLDICVFEDKLEFILGYNDQLYSEDYIKTFINSMKLVLEQYVDMNIEQERICDVELDCVSQLPTFTPVETPFIHKRFEKQVEIKPDDVAIVSNGDEYTYKQLNELSNKIANGLISRGVKPKHNILIMLPRTIDLIASIIGVLKAGCGFIPLDMEYPKERIEYIYENSQADYIIANESYQNALDIKDLLEQENMENPHVELSPSDTAYMIYTSGSTGKPKGVMIGHENACNQVEVNPKAEYDNLLSIATIAFDTSLEDILTGITNGIKIIFANDSEIKNVVDLTKLIKQEKPEVMEFTPSRLLSYLEVEEFCEAISCAKCIVMGGEQFSAKAFNAVKEYTDAKVYNSYGPTEATIASNYKQITDPENITIGKALHNYVTEVRDIDGKLLPQGVMGELYIGGVGVGKGYYNMPDKTKEVYLWINDIPYYRSGDYAIELPDGEIDIKGRIDNQIKLRGLRIEIGEIESNISRFPNIKQNIVVIKEINGSEHLCAYFTSEVDIDTRLLKRYLESKLTKYMVPSVFMQIDEMPQTPNGKTDIKALPEPSLGLNYVEPETETEKKLYKLVSSLASVEQFGITDDLYTLGFTSLTLMKLNSLIYNETEVNIEITDLFNSPSIQSLSDKIDNNIDTQIDIPEIIETASSMDLFPLTANQLGIYYECMQTEEIKYTMPSAIRFGGDVDADKLKQAIIDTIEEHPYLKTRIITTADGQLRQKRCDDAEIDEIEIVEIDSKTNKEMMEKDIKYIPLDDNQLFRFKIYKTPSETVLFSDIHHIITDGVSQDLLFEDIISAYNGGKISKETVDGYAYSLIEEKLSENEVSKEYYKNKFAQGFESTVLTPNLNGNPDEAKIKLIEERISSDFVRLFCKDHSISPNVLFMTATILALNKFTFSDKTLLTTIFNGRSNSNYFNTQGMLVKTLPIMVNSHDREMMVEDFIKLVDKTWKNSLVHSNYPYTKLSEQYHLKPEFFYAYHGKFETDNLELEGNTYAMEELDGTVATDYKINLDIFDDGETIGLILEYNDQLYTKDYVAEFLNAIKYILVQFFVNDMDKLRINEIELADDFELHEFEEVSNPFLHKRFEANVITSPDKTALVASDESLTYDQLNRKANRIANGLIDMGVKAGSNILIMLPRTSDLIASIIGVLKAGCAFIPLDLKFPKERIEYIYENSQADYIINVDGIDPNSLSVKQLLMEDNEENPNVEITPDDLSYMIYTSGSTGNPKGVMISHENACNQVASNPKCRYNNLLSIATIAFDTSLEDILTGITNGIKIIFANDDEIKSIVELIKLIRREKPEVMEFTPSRLLSYLEFDEFCEVISCAKCIVMGGEQFSAKAFVEVKKYCDAAIYNSYGPTEATIASNYKEITNPNYITVGPALTNYITQVRDIDGKLLPKGVMGELYIGGVGVGKGYYNMPDKTREVYLTINNIPYYRSGDYAIELPDGDIDIKGRIDNQIKLRGLRIEIGEIESNISDYPNIKQNTVVIKKIRNNEHLCAYYTAEEEINKDDLKSYLSQRLTQYMVPTVFMQIDEMPQTPNGKTDTKALPEPKLEINYVPPKNKLEQSICAIYSSILDIEVVGAEDNFFEIGGTSLIASKLIIELLKQNYDVKYDDIFRNQTPRKLASFLSGDEISEDLDVEIIENYDYTKINELLSNNTFENFANGRNRDIGNVLLTGVTGFLGIHVLYEYIKNEEGIIYCMLRKGNFDTCEERFIDMMNYYFQEDFSDLIGSRIILTEGDITSLDDFKKLDECPIDTIINCAAIVKHYTHDDYIFRVNVDGVINGLEFAEANNIAYVQISTTSVLDEYTEDMNIDDVHCDEKTLYWGQDLSNKYLNSKFLAERLVLEKALSGLTVKVIRVGNLMARYSDGVFQKNYDTNAFLNNIKAIKNLKATIPAISGEIVELSPIDYVAKATLSLSKTPMESVVFHAVSDKFIPIKKILDVLNSFGYPIKEVNIDEFRKIYEQNMDENIQGIITADLTIDDFDFEYDDENDTGNLVLMDQTLDVLYSLGFKWPECDEGYIEKFIKYLNEVHYFD